MARPEEGGQFTWGPFKLTFSAITRDLAGQSNEILTNRRQLLQNAREEFNHTTLNEGLDKMDGMIQRVLEQETNSGK